MKGSRSKGKQTLKQCLQSNNFIRGFEDESDEDTTEGLEFLQVVQRARARKMQSAMLGNDL